MAPPFFFLVGFAFIIIAVIYTAVTTLWHLKRNAGIRRSVRQLGKILARQEPLDEEGWRKAFPFQLTIIPSEKDISTIRTSLLEIDTPFLEIGQCSAVTGELFFMAGWFRGSVLTGFKRNSFERESMVKLYPAYLLVCKDTPGSVTFFSTEPEDGHHDFYFRDLIRQLNDRIKP